MADILIIDDEESLAYSMKLALERAGHACRVTHTASAGSEECRKSVPELLIVDVQLPDADGIELLQNLRERGLDAPAIVITAHASIARAVEAMKHGAADFLTKPLGMEELCLVVDRCLENRLIRSELSAYREAQQRESRKIKIIGESPAMREVLELADRIAAIPSDESGAEIVATLFLGETGTGKEVLARYIHHRSSRSKKPFVHLNCTAIPENLFESELFGYERGTFTDAKTAKKGLLEIADRGTIFLDEIGDLPTPLQGKLLVAIETGRFRRLGGVAERSVNVRVAAATNIDLESRVEQGTFRADLFYRLQGFSVRLPPLRERGCDVFLLADYFLEQLCQKFHRKAVQLSPEAKEAVRAYAWPGNIRELVNVLRRAVVVLDTELIEPEMLNLNTRSGTQGAPRETAPFAGDFNLASIERAAIRAALQSSDGNISEAARLLGLSRGGLRHRLGKHGMDDVAE